MADGDQMIRVDMTNLTSHRGTPFPKEWDMLGGRALSARILLDECDASCDPLGPDNILVLAPGVCSPAPRRRPRDGCRSGARARSRTGSKKRTPAATRPSI